MFCIKSSLAGIYIHVPFCKSKCPYCDFYSVTKDTDLIKKYFDQICCLIKRYAKNSLQVIDTIYFGGGTPSLASPCDIKRVIDCIEENFKVISPEITVEVNPADYTESDFKKLKESGVNRISFGIQSLCDSQLKILGRRHTAKNCVASYFAAKCAGISNVSFDVIVGVPGQTCGMLDDFINFCKINNVSHISAYMLKIERDTPFFLNKGGLKFLNDDDMADMYEYICGKMNGLGYTHYEISNFAVPGYESRHNLKYWNLDSYLGLGPGAHSLWDNRRFYYSRNLTEFMCNPQIIHETNFEPEKEFIMLSLRTVSGVDLKKFECKVGKKFPEKYIKNAKKLVNYGLVELTSSGFKLPEKSFLVSNSVISKILGY